MARWENLNVCDLIRRDNDQAEREAFERLKAELTRAFSAPDTVYGLLDAETVIARNPPR